jgi:hypothetical protein
MPPTPQLWHIYFVKNCAHTTPIKDKFVLIVFLGKNPRGFLINSNITNWIRKRPHLLACEAPILAAEHPFLKHDSCVDCHELYEFFEWELDKNMGKVSEQAKASVLTAIQLCPSIERRYKNVILRREGRI